MSSSMPLSPHTAIPPPPRRRSSAVDKAMSGISGGGDMKITPLTTQQTTSTIISLTQTPPTLQQRCSQLHTSLMNCTIIELQNLSNQLSLDTTNCNTELDYINLIEKFSRNSMADVSNDINCKDDNDNTIQSTQPINLDDQQLQDVEHINDHNNTPDDIPQDNDYRSHLQTQLHTTLQSLSLIELQSLATRLSIDYSNCLHDKVDENFIHSGVIQDDIVDSEDINTEMKENAVIEKLARQHVIQLIEEKALNLPIVLECGNSSNVDTANDMNNNDDDDDASVISAITTYTSLVNHTRQSSNHTSNIDNTELATEHGKETVANHNILSNNYREYLQSIRNGGYESYEGNNGSDNNVVRLLSHKEEDVEEVENVDKEREVNCSVQSSSTAMSQYFIPPPPPPPRQKVNQRVPVVANNGVIPKEQQHFHLPPPPPPPRRYESRSPHIESSAIDNKFSHPKSTIDESKAASISQTDIDVTNEASQEAVTNIGNDKQEEFLDTISELASQINNTLQGIAPTEDDSPQSNNNNQDEFDIDSLISKNPSQNRSSSDEYMIKEQYKEYLTQKYNDMEDDESLNDSSYKLHMKQVVTKTSTDTNKSNRHRGLSKRSKKSSRKKKLEVLSSVCESTTALDTSSASSASNSDSSEQCESDDDTLTEQTSQLVANLQDYISNI